MHLKFVARSAAAAVVAALVAGPAIPVSAQGNAPINVGVIYSKTGLLSAYGGQYWDGLQAGLDYATHGTGAVDGHKIVLLERDSAGDPAKARTEATDLIGQGTKIIIGPTASGVALSLVPLAQQNNILFISGAAAADGITGGNRNTFRSGRQTYQDVLTAATMLGTNLRGKHVMVFAQDFAFGAANVAAVRQVMGGLGASVDSILAPLSANDFTPFAQKIKDAHPDMVFVAWAGATAGAMWQALEQQGVVSGTRVVTGYDPTAPSTVFGPGADKLELLAYYFPTAPHNKVNDWMVKDLQKQGKKVAIFEPDGFVAAEMLVHAIQAAHGVDVPKMISALDGWTFDAPKGKETVRAADHAMLQVMYVARLRKTANGYEPYVVRTVPEGAVAPPVHPFK